MGFFGALFGNVKLGLQISNQVIKVLLKDKGLFVYPVVMALISFILLVAVFVPFVLLGGLVLGLLGLIVLLIIYYLITTFMSTYFLFALYTAFKAFVAGKPIGMGKALSSTSQYLGLIIKWTLFYTIVVTIIRLIGTRLRGIAGIIFGAIISIGLFLGMTFAIPVIYEDHVGPIEAVKRSATFIINNIGKTFSGIIYFDLIGFVIKAIGVIFIISAIIMAVIDVLGVSIVLYGFIILGHTGLIEIAAIFVIGIAIYVIGALFNYTTLHIYYLVVYEYVKNAKVPEGMDETLIKSSIKHTTGATGVVPGGGQGKGQGQGPAGGLFQSGGDDKAPDLKTFVE